MKAPAIVLVAILCVGCNPESQAPPPQPAQVAVFGPHKVKPFQSTPRRRLGEDCSEFGPAECLSHQCLHTGASPNAGYVCSEECGAAKDCEPGWRCVRLHPNAGNLLCVPIEAGGKQ